MSSFEVINCQYTKWSPFFQSCIYPATVVPAPRSVADVFLRDQLFLPDNNNVVHRPPADDTQAYRDNDDHWHNAITQTEEQHDDTLAQVREPLQRAIDAYETAFVKMNWSAPRDAAWLLLGHGGCALRFRFFDEVLLAMHGSDYIAHDLEKRFVHCDDVANEAEAQRLQSAVDWVFVVKKWKPLRPSSEFRCFVRDKRLIAISQRHANSYFEFLSADRREYIDTLSEFAREHFANSEFVLSDYVADLYVTSKGNVKLLDIGPFAETTNPILFTWQELRSLDAPQPVYRVVESGAAIRPSVKSVTGLPLDFKLGALEPCEGIEQIVEQMKAQIKQQEKEEEQEE